MMKALSLAVALAASLLAAVASAQEVGPFGYKVDRQGRSDWVMNATLYTNEAVAGPSAAVSATCPSNARYIKFDPGTAGDFRTKANGSGTPGAVAVTNGTGWRNNVAELQPINSKVSGTTVASYAVWSAIPSNTVPYACYAE